MKNKPLDLGTAPTHDEYFQENFSDPVAAASLVRLAAPPDVLDTLDLNNMTALPTSQFDPDMGKRIPDLLFECPSTAGRIVVNILFEHKSSPDYHIALKLLRYVLLDYEFRLQHKIKPAALVLPILVYHGKTNWKPNFALIQEAHVPKSLRPYILKIPTITLNLRNITDSTIENIEQLDSHTRATLLAMKHIFSSKPEHKAFMKKLVAKVKAMPIDRRARFVERTSLYLIQMGNVQADIAETLLDAHPDEEIPMRFKSGLQLDRDEARAEGIEQGIEQGLERGMEKGIALKELHDIEIIEGMLGHGLDWMLIQKITHLNQADYEALRLKHGK